MPNCGNVLKRLRLSIGRSTPSILSRKCLPYRPPVRLISRYRPSSEALCRRILRGIPLYQIDTLVDLINLASIYSGNSIGGFDRDKIQGDRLVLGIGKAGEPYEGIGRGELNIEGMPVYRDAVGGIGTPTSDHERTKMSLDTTHVLAIMNAYGGSEGLEDSVNYMVELMKEFAEAHDIEIIYFE